MANDLNQCNFIGRLGADPEMRSMNNGEQAASLRLAVGWKGKSGEGVEWVPVVAFGKLAEIMGQYLRKGSQVHVSGRFRTRKWTDKNGQDRYSTEIIAQDMQMLGGRPEGQQDRQGYQQQTPRQQQQRPQQGHQGGQQREYSPPPPTDFDDEIPF